MREFYVLVYSWQIKYIKLNGSKVLVIKNWRQIENYWSLLNLSSSGSNKGVDSSIVDKISLQRSRLNIQFIVVSPSTARSEAFLNTEPGAIP